MSYAGITVAADESLRVATLRYFNSEGAFATAVLAATGARLPRPLQVVETAGAVLVWRSPTETLCLAASAQRLADLAVRLADESDGCLVDLTGGLKVLRVTGERIGDLLCRLGGTAGVPQPGEARRSRLADLPVLALALRAGETLLVVDRAHLPHLLGWVRETLLDFTDS
jgi:hypothetical protein